MRDEALTRQADPDHDEDTVRSEGVEVQRSNGQIDVGGVDVTVVFLGLRLGV